MGSHHHLARAISSPRPLHLLFVIATVSVLLALSLIGAERADADAPCPGNRQPPCPGASDPLGKPSRYNLFRDDEFYWPSVQVPYKDNHAFTFLPDKDLGLQK
jgi:hypothetical protein